MAESKKPDLSGAVDGPPSKARARARAKTGRARRLSQTCVLACGMTWAALAGAPPSAFAGSTYLSNSTIDLTALLPPPPVSDTQAQRDDIATVIAIQDGSSTERRQQAIADAKASPERFVGTLLGPAFTATNEPKTFALLRRVTHDGGLLTESAKMHWGRPRPFLLDPRIKLLVDKPDNPAYPSGHTTFAYEMAVILGTMVPEKRAALFARAADYGQSRIIVGVHYLTDIDAGRSAGTAIAALLLATPHFQADLKDATTELRQALGMAAR